MEGIKENSNNSKNSAILLELAVLKILRWIKVEKMNIK